MNINKTSILIVLFTVIFSTKGYASGLTGEKLINSCKEAIAIYSKKNNEMKSYAALTTSLSEAFEGGYCMGAIQAYLSVENYYCGSGNWHDSAKHIASLDPDEYSSSSKILKQACL